MARSANPNSANSQFFICFKAASHLDRQYTVFGKVIKGMEFVDLIKRGEGSNGEVSKPDKIISLSAKWRHKPVCQKKNFLSIFWVQMKILD